jgi:hypothetical protein
MRLGGELTNATSPARAEVQPGKADAVSAVTSIESTPPDACGVETCLSLHAGAIIPKASVHLAANTSPLLAMVFVPFFSRRRLSVARPRALPRQGGLPATS